MTANDFSQQDYFAKMLADQVDLLPELEAARTKINEFEAIKHKFVNEVPYFPQMNKLYNDRFEGKTAHLAHCLETKDWFGYIWTHEKPWRVDALIEIASLIEDDKTYWELVGNVWQTSENIYQWGPFLREALLAERPGREHMMDEDDREMFDSLDDEFVAWRGHQERNRNGWSWTIDYDKAVWFAKRYRGQGTVTKGRIKKADVICTFVAESEVVINPKLVSQTSDKEYLN